eukprot:CAMPEP_0197705344 /NCGR_PEP_ID=MMETSP1338-20131121/126396_1 /TAXON_ID=43686 ORGANISM="Pelagodinium beii, Strain RCC1491" /NCGR_SAMPLE_ID=MMETSP1338 /ASSEMBLY_ACC=CAM_ASM_000754 /LENGTH=754 /DNA_ID=CAMNT_0043289253 /DNA_START=63 /DNA_END=2327 /DNA_ORIENTATION=-
MSKASRRLSSSVLGTSDSKQLPFPIGQSDDQKRLSITSALGGQKQVPATGKADSEKKSSRNGQLATSDTAKRLSATGVTLLHNQIDSSQLRKVNAMIRNKMQEHRGKEDETEPAKKPGTNRFKVAAKASAAATKEVIAENNAKKEEMGRKLMVNSYHNVIFEKQNEDLQGMDEISEAYLLHVFKVLSDLELRHGKDVLMVNLGLQLLLETIVTSPSLDDLGSEVNENLDLMMEAVECVLPDSGNLSIVGREKDFLAELRSELISLKVETENEFRYKDIRRPFAKAAQNVVALKTKLTKMISKRQKKSLKRFQKTVKKLNSVWGMKGKSWTGEKAAEEEPVAEAKEDSDADDAGTMALVQSQQPEETGLASQENDKPETPPRMTSKARSKSVHIKQDPDDTRGDKDTRKPFRRSVYDMTVSAARKSVAVGELKRATMGSNSAVHHDKTGPVDLTAVLRNVSKQSSVAEKLTQRGSLILADHDIDDSGSEGKKSADAATATQSRPTTQSQHEEADEAVRRRDFASVFASASANAKDASTHSSFTDEELKSWEMSMRDWVVNKRALDFEADEDIESRRKLLEKMAAKRLEQMAMESTRGPHCEDCWLCKCCGHDGGLGRGAVADISATFLPAVPIPRAAPGYWLGLDLETPSMRSTFFSPARAQLQRARARRRVTSFGSTTQRFPKFETLNTEPESFISTGPASDLRLRSIGSIGRSLRHRMVKVRRGKEVHVSGICPHKDLLAHLDSDQEEEAEIG